MDSRCKISRRPAGHWHHDYVATGETLVAHKTFDKADGLAVGSDTGLGDLPLGLVDFAHVAVRGINCVEASDPPVAVAGTVRCGADPTGGVRQPIVFVNVDISA